MISKKYFLTLILILTIFFSESSATQDSVLNNTISKVIINKININGNKKTKKNIITRELSFEEGQEFDKEKILSIINEDKRKIINTHNIYINFFQKNQKSTVVYALNDLHRHKKHIIASHFCIITKNFTKTSAGKYILHSCGSRSTTLDHI